LLQHDQCEFEQTTIEYLGLIISDGEVRMDPVKVAVLAEWSVLTMKKGVQSFLGFANFYQHFIEGFAHHVKPLFELKKKDWKWSWGVYEQWAFNSIKNKVMSCPILHFADDSKPFHIALEEMTVEGAEKNITSGD
jgi:hypothetical protein